MEFRVRQGLALLRDCAIITWSGLGGWQMGEIAPKLSHTPPLIKQKLISTPSHNDSTKTNPPPTLERL